MDFSILTYNTLFSHAVKGLKKVCEKQHPDIICLQEVDTTDATLDAIQKLGYRLADYSNAFIKYGHIYGVATFYNPEKFSFSESKVIFLPKGIMEIVVYLLRIFRTGKKNRTVLKTDLVCKKSKTTISVYNIHLSAHGTNSIRIKQIQTTLNDINPESRDEKKVTILTGDFNYPYGRKKLEAMMQEYDFKEATNTIMFTTEGTTPNFTAVERFFARIFFSIMRNKLKLDYVFYRNCTAIMAKKIDVDYSDHYPVYAVFKLGKHR